MQHYTHHIYQHRFQPARELHNAAAPKFNPKPRHVAILPEPKHMASTNAHSKRYNHRDGSLGRTEHPTSGASINHNNEVEIRQLRIWQPHSKISTTHGSGNFQASTWTKVASRSSKGNTSAQQNTRQKPTFQ
ncbi:hypothetical protein Nepgr_006583 [Nepenthes gracilis]|uniref:Uncharacterized protein n=1 Tax=Nepenthes gracilis TaxID=150966 RepID=A0AAD3S5B2_NEPGR|nr:hypothetical protein Nepgr_006583 [Nepenthes gracilis]